MTSNLTQIKKILRKTLRTLSGSPFHRAVQRLPRPTRSSTCQWAQGKAWVRGYCAPW